MTKPDQDPRIHSPEAIKAAVDEATEACNHFMDKYGKCSKNWQRTSLMRGGDMRYACEEFYDDFRACIVESLHSKGITDVPFFGVSPNAPFPPRNS